MPENITVLIGRDGHKYDLSRVSDEFQRLVHELSTHKFELEAQNEELRNIQETLEESRDRYTDLYDHAPIGYATICRNGLIHEANQTLVHMLGTTKSELIGSPFSRYIKYADQDVWYLNHRQLFDKGSDLNCELNLKTEKGEFCALVAGKSQKTTSESDSFVRCVISDISQRKKDEQERKQLEKRISQSQKLESLELIVGGIAHDYNNLLMGVMGNLELATMKLLPDHEVVPFLKNAQSAASLLADLTNQMLAYAGRGNSTIETLDLCQVVQDLSDLLRSIVSKNVSIQYDVHCSECLIDIDPSQLHQILINFAINASEAMEHGGDIWIRAGVMQADADYLRRCFLGEKRVPGDYVYLEFEDQGSGIDPGILDRIFDPFFSTKQDGRGMGLAAVLGIIQKHQGAINVSSILGRGSRFRVLFPVSSNRKAVPVVGRIENPVLRSMVRFWWWMTNSW